MSKFTRVDTKITDLETLKAALDRMGIEYRVGDNLTAHRYTAGRVNVRGAVMVIPRQETERFSVEYSDTIVRIGPDGYVAFEHDHYSTPIHTLVSAYALEKTLKAAHAQGFNIKEQELQRDGSVRLLMQKRSNPRERIEGTVKPDGSLELEAKGFKGKACSIPVSKLQQAVGGDILEEKNTRDYYDDKGQGVAVKNWDRW